MTPVAAAQLLNVSPDATPEQIEVRFHELRTKLEDKIAKAPTPGLKAKYRESLEEITLAFETLTLAADASALPVLQRQKAEDGGRTTEDGGRKAAPTVAPVAASRPAATRKSGSREFVIVAIIAVALLGVGGWWVMKTKAENEEKARVAAEVAAAAKAESERVERLAREKAEQERLTAEAEKTRQEKLLAETSARLADLRITWDAVEQEIRKSDRRLNELRSDERSLANAAKAGPTPDLLRLRAEIAAQVAFHDWLESEISRHDAKVLRAQAEAMVAVRQYDEAARIAGQASEAQAKLDRAIAETRAQMLALTGSLAVTVAPAAAEWSLTDAYGETHRGRGAGELSSIPWGPVTFTTNLPGYKPKQIEGVLRRGETLTLTHEFKPAKFRIDSVPTGAEIMIGKQSQGRTPATIEWPGDGAVELTLQLAGFEPSSQKLDLVAGKITEGGTVSLRKIPTGLVRPDLDKGPMRYVSATQFSMYYASTDNTRVTDDYVSNTQINTDHKVEVESPNGSYTDATRMIVTTRTHTSNGQNAFTPGTVYEYTQDESGWTRQRKAGGAIDPNVQAHMKDGPVPTPGGGQSYLQAAEWWPTEEKQVGETWSVPVSVAAASGIVTAFKDNQKGNVTGRLVNLQANATRQIAEIEYTFDVTSSLGGAVAMESRCTGRITATVDLRRNYLSTISYNTQTTQNSSYESLKTVTTIRTNATASVTPL